MAARTTSRLSWLLSGTGLARTLVEQLRLATRLLRDPAVPLLFKGLPIAAGIYLVSPLDLVPDLLPVLGQMDDLGLLLVAVQAFIKLCPATAVQHHRSALAEGRPFSPVTPAGQVIDAEFRRHDSAH